MILSSRVKDTKASVTLKVNEKINELARSGKHIYNMTSGQLPFKPSSEFITNINKQLNFLKSYQYSPIAGMPELRSKFVSYVEESRDINFSKVSDNTEFECVISNGSKHSLYNVFGALLNPGDEVILLTPYWVSYPEMVKFWGGVPVVVKSHAFDAYTPQIEEIEKAISPKTKAIIINSPNNPAGIHYSGQWMQDFASFLKKHPDLIAISDEIYSEVSYFDPKPSYFYQYDQSLLPQTVIINGISKALASTGLRVGYCIADATLTKAVAKIQSQTTSGPNSLIQKALVDFDFSQMNHFLDPIKSQLRECAQIVREHFREANLPHCYYQTTSAFYYLLDFTRMPIYEKFKTDDKADMSKEIVEDILEQTGVALVPGSAFGYPNSARMSMTLEVIPFKEAMTKLVDYINTH
jgi:aspartate aminotransferase